MGIFGKLLGFMGLGIFVESLKETLKVGSKQTKDGRWLNFPDKDFEIIEE